MKTFAILASLFAAQPATAIDWIEIKALGAITRCLVRSGAQVTTPLCSAPGGLILPSSDPSKGFYCINHYYGLLCSGRVRFGRTGPCLHAKSATEVTAAACSNTSRQKWNWDSGSSHLTSAYYGNDEGAQRLASNTVRLGPITTALSFEWLVVE